jgi:multidrug efflux pump subunit AcrA (membrane-fusion protein)
MKKIILAAAGGPLVLILLIFLVGFGGNTAGSVPTATADTRSLKIALLLEGTLQPYNFVRIKADITSIRELTITHVVANGTYVKKEEKLIEFDPADVDDAISKAELEVRSAETEVVNATEERKKSDLDKDLNLKEAEFRLEVARKNIEKYKEVEYQKEIDALRVAIDKAKVDEEESQKNLEAAKELFKEELVPEFEVKKNDILLKQAEFATRTAVSDLDLFEKYRHPLRLQELQNEVDSSSRLLESRTSYFGAILSQRDSQLEKAKYALDEAKKRLEKLKKDKENLAIAAPVEGIVNYGQPGTGMIRWGREERDLKVGDKVFAQETLMYIPDLKEMFVQLQVDEVDISKLLISDAAKEEEKKPEESTEEKIDIASLTEEQLLGVFMKAQEETKKLFESIDMSKVDRSKQDFGAMLSALDPEDQKKVKKFLAKHLSKKPATRFKRLRVDIVAEGFRDTKITGVVDYVAGAAAAGAWWEETTKFEVKVKLDNSFDWFRPGMKMKADVLVEETGKVTVVPVDAVFSKDVKSVCYVRRGGIFSPTEVQTGRTDKNFIEVISGIAPGDVVALANPEKR